VLVATAGALSGAVVGRAMLHKVTLVRLQHFIGILLFLVGTALALGVI
jgi:hypothetical protein